MRTTVKQYAICLGIFIVLQNASALAQDDDRTRQLKACAEIEAADTRLACYEAISREAAAEENKGAAEASSPAPAAAVTTATAATSAPTNVPFKGSSKPVEEHRIAVSSCQKNSVNDTYLLFENGEIWKQTSGKRLKDSECSFSATLRKDFFGYRLTMDGDKGSFRVKRVK